MLSRGKGWLPSLYEPNEPDFMHRHDRPASIFLGAEPDEFLEMEASIGYIQDQGSSSSCVGQALVGCVETRARRQGVSLPRLSALAAYTGGRSLEATATITDSGSRASDVITFLQNFGVVTEDRWPLYGADGRVNQQVVNTPLAVDVFQHGHAAKVTDYYRVIGKEQALVDALVHAIFNEFPVAHAGPVDDAWYNLQKDAMLDLPDGSYHGHHMTSLHGYSRDDSDPYGFRFRGRNSWGRGWGDEGFYWISARRLVRQHADFLAIRVAPEEAT